jgi:carboxyl-terminal processing protease
MNPPSQPGRPGRSRFVFFLLSLTLLASLAGGRWFVAAAQQVQGEDSLYKYLSTFTEVLSLVSRAYVDETDVETLMIGALDGTTDALDPFSVYVPAAQLESYVAAREIGTRYSGVTLLKERGIAFVLSVAEGSPAAEADVRGGDVVTTIDGRSTRLMPLWEVQRALAGKPGQKVEMGLIRRGEEMTSAFTLAPFEVPAARLEAISEGERHGSLLRIGRFDERTPEAVTALVRQAREAGHGRLLVDLRDSSEGDGAIAYQVGGLFAQGELGRLMRRDQALEVFREEEAPLWDGALVVLVNRGTLGAAEVLASILAQRADAELVGETTFGHAGRQERANLSTGGGLFFTSAFFTGPDGEPLDEGLEPDQVVDAFVRGLDDRETPLSELILRRGISRLLADAAPAAREAA